MALASNKSSAFTSLMSSPRGRNFSPLHSPKASSTAADYITSEQLYQYQQLLRENMGLLATMSPTALRGNHWMLTSPYHQHLHSPVKYKEEEEGLLDLSLKPNPNLKKNLLQSPNLRSPSSSIPQDLSPAIRKEDKLRRSFSTGKIPESRHLPGLPQGTQSVPVKNKAKLGKSPRKTKAVRKLKFDEDKSSPVSGTIIRDIKEVKEGNFVKKLDFKREENCKYEETAIGIQVTRHGDIDPAFNTVEVTDEAREEIAKIENKIGAYICRLCKDEFEDVFGLAQHSCACIVHVEYRCPECDKVFSCPANLASHRRWHKPRDKGKASPKKPKNSTKGIAGKKNQPEQEDKHKEPEDNREQPPVQLRWTGNPSEENPDEDEKNNNHQGILLRLRDPPELPVRGEKKTSRVPEFEYNCVICRDKFHNSQDFQVHLTLHFLKEKNLPYQPQGYLSLSPSSSTSSMQGSI